MDILTDAVARGTSDILIIAGLPVSYKINGVTCREGRACCRADTAALTERSTAWREIGISPA